MADKLRKWPPINPRKLGNVLLPMAR